MNAESQRTDRQKPTKTAWTEERIRSLFLRYNRRYWRGQLPDYRLVIAAMPDALGLCDAKRKVITIDADQHKSDRELRGTILHEMAHAAAFIRGSRGHDLKFFAQLENLLRLRAPIAIDTPEAGGVRVYANLVPSRFPLLKRKIDLAETRRSMTLENFFAERNLPTRLITDEDILRDFESAAWEVTWKPALIQIGLENGLIDETGRPVNRRANRLLQSGKRRYARARRDYLEDKKRNEDPKAGIAAYMKNKSGAGISRIVIPPLELPKQNGQS